MINFDGGNTNTIKDVSNPKTTYEFYKPDKMKKDKDVLLPHVKNKKKDLNLSGDQINLNSVEKSDDKEPRM